MLKILFLPTRYYPSISGAEFYFQRLAEILYQKYNYQIDIFTSNALDFKALRSPSGKIIKKNHKNYRSVNSINVNRYPVEYNFDIDERHKYLKDQLCKVDLSLNDSCLTEYLKNGPFLKALFDIFSKKYLHNYDLIHTTFFPYFNLIIGLWIGKLLKLPVVCTPFFHFSNPRYSNNILIEPLRQYDTLIACTSLEKKFLIKNYDIKKTKIKVLPMGVDLKRFNNDESSGFKFKEFYFRKGEKNHKMILFCGYKNFEKGALSILKSIPKIIKKVPKVYFVFIGPSTIAFNRELKAIRKKFDVQIINLTPDNLRGYYDPQKIAAFKETDLYLMPSRSDAYGIAFLEGWASKKPVIGANIGATPEVINDKKDGYLVKFDDPDDISVKVIELLNKKTLRKRLGNMGYEKIIKNNTWEIIVERTNNLYQEIIKSKEKK